MRELKVIDFRGGIADRHKSGTSSQDGKSKGRKVLPFRTTTRKLQVLSEKIRLLTVEPSVDSIDDILHHVPEDAAIFLPIDRERIVEPLKSATPEFYDTLFDEFPQALFFATTQPQVYEAGQDAKYGFLRQFNHMWRSEFRYGEIRLAQNAMKEEPDWPSKTKVFIGDQEEVLHLYLHYCMTLTDAVVREDKLADHLPKFWKPTLSQRDKEIYGYLKELRYLLYDKYVDSVPINGLPREPSSNWMMRLSHKVRFSRGMKRAYAEAVYDHREVMDALEIVERAQTDAQNLERYRPILKKP